MIEQEESHTHLALFPVMLLFAHNMVFSHKASQGLGFLTM